MSRVRVGIIGLGDRGISFVRNFEAYSELAEVTGILERNRPRAEAMAKWHGVGDIPCFETWDEFVAGARCDLVLVTTPDDTHPEMIVKGLEAGLHVFAEKPLANSAEGLRAIMGAYERSDRMLMMGFNMRYHNLPKKMKEIAQRGELGNILIGNCHHPETGIRYFRRWHKYRAKVRGLVIHKGCHQLDLMNWIVGSHPVEVYAQGDLAVFKGDKTVPGCHDCPESKTCPYARRLDHRSEQRLRDIYINPASVDGYTRNYCPISAEDGVVPDFYLVTIRYANGARATYNEIHFAGRSGMDWSFYGDKAMLTANSTMGNTIERVDMLSGERAVYDVPTAKGGHGGADPVMTMDIITSVLEGVSKMPPPEAGVRSSVIGIAAMQSIEEGRPVRIDEIIPMEYVERCPEEVLSAEAAVEDMGYSGALGQ